MSGRARELRSCSARCALPWAASADRWARSLKRYGARLARRGVELSRLSASIEHVKRRVVRLIVAAYNGQPERLERALCAAQRFGDRALAPSRRST